MGVTFGDELRRRREARGLSLRALGDLVCYTGGYLHQIERGYKPATREVAERCDEALKADGALSALVVNRDVPHLHRAGLIDLFTRTDEDSEVDLFERIRAAQHRVNLFGLTRNYYVRDHVLPEIERVAERLPVNIYMMDPTCQSRADRYRVEPAEAALEDPQRFIREILTHYQLAVERTPNLSVWLYNFPCSFAIEEVDDTYRVMLYGHGKRGTQGPIFVVDAASDLGDYFASQMRWLERLVTDPGPAWKAKGLTLRPLASVLPQP
ncbi:MAG: helix-turn-helix domain-containing protein [Micromonosporaceae bacterium]